MLTEDQQIFDQIKKAKNILITCKEDYSGDTLSAAMAFLLWLRQLEKKATAAISGFKDTKDFDFLPNIKNIVPSLNTEKKFTITLDISQTKAEDIVYQTNGNKIEFIITPQGGEFSESNVKSYNSGPVYDLIVVLGSSDLNSLGKIFDENTSFFFATPIINIDHRPNNEEFGQINKINITAISTTEIIYQLIKNYSPESITSEIATCLLTGIITESKSFKIGSLTPNSLLSASKLIDLGADREMIIRRLYQSRKIDTLKLWGRVLAKLKEDLSGRLIWSCLNKNDFDKTGAGLTDLSGVIEELIINVPAAEIIVLFVENNKSTVVNLYAGKNINALLLLEEFNANGSKDHSYVSIEKSIIETEEKIIEHLKKELAKLSL